MKDSLESSVTVEHGKKYTEHLLRLVTFICLVLWIMVIELSNHLITYKFDTLFLFISERFDLIINHYAIYFFSFLVLFLYDLYIQEPT